MKNNLNHQWYVCYSRNSHMANNMMADECCQLYSVERSLFESESQPKRCHLFIVRWNELSISVAMAKLTPHHTPGLSIRRLLRGTIQCQSATRKPSYVLGDFHAWHPRAYNLPTAWPGSVKLGYRKSMIVCYRHLSAYWGAVWRRPCNGDTGPCGGVIWEVDQDRTPVLVRSPSLTLARTYLLKQAVKRECASQL